MKIVFSLSLILSINGTHLNKDYPQKGHPVPRRAVRYWGDPTSLGWQFLGAVFLVDDSLLPERPYIEKVVFLERERVQWPQAFREVLG